MLKLAADDARGVVRGIDEANEAAPKRRAGVLANTKPLADMVASLEAIDERESNRALQREVAAAVAAALDDACAKLRRRLRLCATKRGSSQRSKSEPELAKPSSRLALYAPAHCCLFRSDSLVVKFGKIAYSRVPVPGTLSGFYVRTFDCLRAPAEPMATDAASPVLAPAAWRF